MTPRVTRSVGSPEHRKGGARDAFPDTDLESSFDLGIMASTPLKYEDETFLSPMNKLNRLHLESDCENHLGNQTLTSHSDDEKLPNYRKRHLTESPSDMIITPSNSGPNSKMSICINNSSNISKLSFSQSDSTPCPVQPRKRLKFKKNNNVSPRINNNRRILNLSNSVKTSVATKLNTALSDDDNLKTINTSIFSKGQESTPISQSTPANSRDATPSPASVDSVEFGDSINGFHFVRPKNSSVSTPKLKSYNLRNLYNQSNIIGKEEYEIIGEVETNNSDIHVGDRRTDPYNEDYDDTDDDIEQSRKRELRKQYFSDDNKLPLTRCFEDPKPKKAELIQIINDQNSVMDFLNQIKLSDEELTDLIKSERRRWHPDKWHSKLKQSHLPFDIEIINNLSQALNAIVEQLN
ncbi:uncharacterized protein PRCAT00005210001 [Priceomyces carsonii]|uniref:uncharacterized protein n=1 Tax=Priceomyces carsonii TaxID=28549 RepID=UPI002ED8AEC5|nr:unnamed protein product [Priceomyces carsonii]